MDRKKILYFGNFKNETPTIDQDILYSLKKKADVITVDLREFAEDNDIRKIIMKANECDIFLFHALIPETNNLYIKLMLERIVEMLEGMTCKKVLWFLDKIAGSKMEIIVNLLPHVDYMFVADGTWKKRFTEEKLFVLHPAASEKIFKGKVKDDLVCDIAMYGSLYGERFKQFEFLKSKFGDHFQYHDDKYGRDLANLCKSSKIVIVPQYPFDDFYWSDRIYNVLANGGTCVHPRTYGLQEEGFIDGTHFIDYYTEQDLFVTLSMLLDKKSNTVRKGIGKQGKEFVKGHTYGNRIDEMLNIIYETKTESI